MNPPEFWSRSPVQPGLAAHLLSPASALYGLIVRTRLKQPPQFRPPVPVICVGNLTVGGTGKTPAAIALLQRLKQMRIAPVALSRGYGGSLKGPVIVEPDHLASEVGDEPLLLARHATTIIAKDRAAGARACIEASAGIIVMDDGFQNPAVAKDMNIVVVDSEAGFGNGRVFPAGPLRERAADGLARADAVILMGNGPFDPGHKRTLRATLKAPLGSAFSGRRVLAFAGIGRPAKFFDTLAQFGADITATVAFPDHHPYTDDDMERMQALADGHAANLITTEKDFARLPPRLRRGVLTLPVEAVFEDQRALDALLFGLLARAHMTS
jgi:tetraacyldisaccharide 4'-kinase